MTIRYYDGYGKQYREKGGDTDQEDKVLVSDSGEEVTVHSDGNLWRFGNKAFFRMESRTVAELIEALQKLNPDLLVVGSGECCHGNNADITVYGDRVFVGDP